MYFNKMSPSYYILFMILILNMCITSAQDEPPVPAPVPPILVTKLIHHQSENSPFFNPNTSIKDLADFDLATSISRALSLTANTSASLELTDIDSQLTPGKQNGFLVHLRVGSSYLVDQFVYMDTGSNLLWINCEPCGHNVPWPVYDPKLSPTYEPEACDYGDICDATGAVQIDCASYFSDVDGCKYKVAYGGRGSSKGFLGRETFKFGIISNEILENIVFGCARSTNLYMNGILGLGNLQISLLSQYKASKFSYCIGNINDRSYEYNELVIGNKVELWGSQTPLIVESKYYINLEGIAVGKTSLSLDPKTFKRNSVDYTGGMIVDTGSTLTFIPLVALTQLEEAVSRLIVQEALRVALSPNHTISYQSYTRLCYNGNLDKDLKGLTKVKFQFQGSAIMELSADNIFQQISDQTFCLAILPSELLGTSTISILGNLMQQYFYVAYDLQEKKLSFKRTDCKDVDDYYEHDEH